VVKPSPRPLQGWVLVETRPGGKRPFGRDFPWALDDRKASRAGQPSGRHGYSPLLLHGHPAVTSGQASGPCSPARHHRGRAEAGGCGPRCLRSLIDGAAAGKLGVAGGAHRFRRGAWSAWGATTVRAARRRPSQATVEERCGDVKDPARNLSGCCSAASSVRPASSLADSPRFKAVGGGEVHLVVFKKKIPGGRFALGMNAAPCRGQVAKPATGSCRLALRRSRAGC